MAFCHRLDLYLITADADFVCRIIPLISEINDPYPIQLTLGLHHVPEVDVVPSVSLVQVVTKYADHDE